MVELHALAREGCTAVGGEQQGIGDRRVGDGAALGGQWVSRGRARGRANGSQDATACLYIVNRAISDPARNGRESTYVDHPVGDLTHAQAGGGAELLLLLLGGIRMI